MEILLEHQNMESMGPYYRSLLDRFSEEEKISFKENVDPDKLDCIASWMGTREEVERMLFWDKWGKYDSPEWHWLSPLDEDSQRLHEQVGECYRHLRAEAAEIQMRSDLSLFSQYNRALLFTGMAGAVRCNAEGVSDRRGAFFRGVELRCIGSVEEHANTITLYPLKGGGFDVHFGSRVDGKPRGIHVYSGDSYSLLQLAKLVDRDLGRSGFEAVLIDHAGVPVTLESKAIRKAARKGDRLHIDPELRLFAGIRVKGPDEAIERARYLSDCFYRRFGMETECYKIGKKYGNFRIMRDDNFHELLPEGPAKGKGLVLFTATLGCRRCRREIEAFKNYAMRYPEVTFAIVNLNSPQTRFYERVFGDMGGGDPRNFRDNPSGSTPFTIVYVPDENGVLQFAEYYGTEKAEAPPSEDACTNLFDKYFSPPPWPPRGRGVLGTYSPDEVGE